MVKLEYHYTETERNQYSEGYNGILKMERHYILARFFCSSRVFMYLRFQMYTL